MSFSLFDQAQRKSIDILRATERDLVVNMTQSDILACIHKHARSHDVTGWLRPPLIRISSKTGIQGLQKGSVLQIHIQPVFDTAFGSIGNTQSFKNPTSHVVEEARELCFATCTFANRRKCVGELFVFAHSWCTNHRVELEHKKNIGHRCFSKEEMPGFWPLSARAMSMLRRHQIQWFNPRRLQGIFAVHPFIEKYELFAGFAEMIYISEDQRIILGRESFEDIGS